MRPVAVDFAAPVDVVFGYLSDPARRPEWQGSLRRVEALRGDGAVGTTWRDVTAVGARPRMEVTEVDPGRTLGRGRPLARDRGRASGSASRKSPTGTAVTATVDVTTSLRAATGRLGAAPPGAVRRPRRPAPRRPRARFVTGTVTKGRTRKAQSMKALAAGIGALMILVGLVWMLQGLGYLERQLDDR